MKTIPCCMQNLNGNLCNCRQTGESGNSRLTDGLAAEVSKAEEGRRLAGEIIATLSVNIERGHLPEVLLERVEIWKRQLEECGG